jgi:hypothetical protein
MLMSDSVLVAAIGGVVALLGPTVIWFQQRADRREVRREALVAAKERAAQTAELATQTAIAIEHTETMGAIAGDTAEIKKDTNGRLTALLDKITAVEAENRMLWAENARLRAVTTSP